MIRHITARPERKKFGWRHAPQVSERGANMRCAVSSRLSTHTPWDLLQRSHQSHALRGLLPATTEHSRSSTAEPSWSHADLLSWNLCPGPPSAWTTLSQNCPARWGYSCCRLCLLPELSHCSRGLNVLPAYSRLPLPSALRSPSPTKSSVFLISSWPLLLRGPEWTFSSIVTWFPVVRAAQPLPLLSSKSRELFKQDGVALLQNPRHLYLIICFYRESWDLPRVPYCFSLTVTPSSVGTLCHRSNSFLPTLQAVWSFPNQPPGLSGKWVMLGVNVENLPLALQRYNWCVQDQWTPRNFFNKATSQDVPCAYRHACLFKATTVPATSCSPGPSSLILLYKKL